MNQNRKSQVKPTIAGRAASARFLTVLAVVILLAIAANVLMTVKLRELVSKPPVCPEPRRSLPCEAIPIRLIHEAPACVNTLLQAMNVTNVRVLANVSQMLPPDRKTAAQTRTPCREFANTSLPLPAIHR